MKILWKKDHIPTTQKEQEMYMRLIRTRYHPTSYSSSCSATTPSGPRSPHWRGSTTTLRHTTLGRTPLDECSTRRRDLYLTTHNTQKRQISIPLAGFEPTIPASERPHTLALDRTASEIAISLLNVMNSHHFTSCTWPETLFILLYRTTPESHKLRSGCIRIYQGGSNRRMEKTS
jgi:hypothetical protein